jgi:hypothetical protein
MLQLPMSGPEFRRTYLDVLEIEQQVIAQHTGYSTGTISKEIRSEDPVSPTVRERIFAVVMKVSRKKLKYEEFWAKEISGKFLFKR